jgi:hypothetical protein
VFGVVLHARAQTSPPAVTLGTVIRSGAIGVTEARGVVTSALPRFASCYEQRAAAAPGLRGILILRVYVSSDGEPVAASTRGSPLDDRELARCVEREGLALRFAEHETDTDLRFALRFGGATEDRPGTLPPIERIGG